MARRSRAGREAAGARRGSRDRRRRAAGLRRAGWIRLLLVVRRGGARGRRRGRWPVSSRCLEAAAATRLADREAAADFRAGAQGHDRLERHARRLSRDRCIHDIFEAQALGRRAPSQPRFATSGHVRGPNGAANRLAPPPRGRRRRRLSPGICMERSTDMLVGLLGVLSGSAAPTCLSIWLPGGTPAVHARRFEGASLHGARPARCWTSLANDSRRAGSRALERRAERAGRRDPSSLAYATTRRDPRARRSAFAETGTSSTSSRAWISAFARSAGRLARRTSSPSTSGPELLMPARGFKAVIHGREDARTR
jgi:hypothetical protein